VNEFANLTGDVGTVMRMNNLIKVEELALTALAVFLYHFLPYAWWWFAVWFLAPDLSMVGYLAGPRVGAFTYNLVHHKAVAVAVYIAGYFAGSHAMELAGLVMLAHSSLDRVLGYGLKYPDAFKHTHLGTIGVR
jgi:hypothetical protein